jgi:hypothetical protein
MFVVKSIPLAERQYLDILAGATTHSASKAIRDAMTEAASRILHDARSCGEPLFDLPRMKMTVCRILVPPLYVEFGVHHVELSAVIRRVVLLR